MRNKIVSLWIILVMFSCQQKTNSDELFQNGTDRRVYLALCHLEKNNVSDLYLCDSLYWLEASRLYFDYEGVVGIEFLGDSCKYVYKFNNWERPDFNRGECREEYFRVNNGQKAGIYELHSITCVNDSNKKKYRIFEIYALSLPDLEGFTTVFSGGYDMIRLHSCYDY